MIHPTPASVGRAVVYRSPAMRQGLDKHPAEQGIITSLSTDPLAVFVRYGANPGSASTRVDDLDWMRPTEDEETEDYT